MLWNHKNKHLHVWSLQPHKNALSKTIYVIMYTTFQKQPPDVFCKKLFGIFHAKTPVLESLFNKVLGLKTCNFIKKLQRRGSLVKFLRILRTPILKNIWERVSSPAHLFAIRGTRKRLNVAAVYLFLKAGFSPSKIICYLLD